MKLNELLPLPVGVSAKQIAITWQEKWNKSYNVDIAFSTVESRLSDLRKEKIDGVRFFYSDTARAALLEEVLDLNSNQKEAARQRAEDILLREGHQQPRLVLILAGISHDATTADQLFQKIKQDFLINNPVLPLALVVDELQYDRLPRSFDELKPRLSYWKVANAEEGHHKAKELAGDSGVVGSRQPIQPYDRWLLLHLKNGNLAYAPAQGPEQIREYGRVSTPPTPDVDAEDWLDEQMPKVALPTDPLKIRAMVDGLGLHTITETFGTLAERVALGRLLGVKVAATAKEVEKITNYREKNKIEVELKNLQQQLNLPLAKGGEAEVERLRQEAAFTQVKPALFRIEDCLYLIGNEDLKAPNHKLLKVYREKIRPNSLQRLLDVVDCMTLDDWRDDPLLEKVILKDLAPEDEEEQLRLFHAKSCLILSESLTPAKPKLVDNWKESLEKLMSSDPPASKLLLQVKSEKFKWIDDILSINPWIYFENDNFINQNDLFKSIPPLTTPFVDRNQKINLYCPSHGNSFKNKYKYNLNEIMNCDLMILKLKNKLENIDQSYYEYREELDKNNRYNFYKASAMNRFEFEEALNKNHENQIKKLNDLKLNIWDGDKNGSLIIINPKKSRDPQIWFEIINASNCFKQGIDNILTVNKFYEELLIESKLPKIEKIEIDVPCSVWDKADIELAMVWMSIKKSIKKDDSIKLHDGSILLKISDGIAANINIRHSKSNKIEAALWLDILQEDKWGLGPLNSYIETHQAYTRGYRTCFGPTLPSCITINGIGISVDIKFLASALLSDKSFENFASVAATAATIL
jgi:hypothetical protein